MTTASRCRDVFLSLYIALVGPHLEKYGRSGAPQCKKGVGTMEQIQQRTSRWSEAGTHEVGIGGPVHP